jgi:hypothetical protein
MAEVVTMRNVRTGELRPAIAESEEFLALKQEVYDHDGSSRPLWEQTGEHHARRVVENADDGALREPDAGYDHKPFGDVVTDTSDVQPEPDPHLALTQGEVESGLTVEAKQEQLADQMQADAARVAEKRHAAAIESVKASEGIDLAPDSSADEEEADLEDEDEGDEFSRLHGDELDKAVADAEIDTSQGGSNKDGSLNAEEKRAALRERAGANA